MPLKLGDRVCIDTPDELDPDFNLHGEHVIVLDNDPARCRCGCKVLYKVALETRDLSIEMHPWDLRPPIEPMPPIESDPKRDTMGRSDRLGSTVRITDRDDVIKQRFEMRPLTGPPVCRMVILRKNSLYRSEFGVSKRNLPRVKRSERPEYIRWRRASRIGETSLKPMKQYVMERPLLASLYR